MERVCGVDVVLREEKRESGQAVRMSPKAPSEGRNESN